MKTAIKNLFCNLQPASLAARAIWIRLLIVFLSGAACSLALPPYGLWPLFYLGFCAFVLCLLAVPNKRSAFISGWLFGIGYFLFGIGWIGNALLVEGNEFWWVWPLAVIALPIALGLFTAFGSLFAFHMHKKWGAAPFLSLCLILALAEYARGHLFTGFPWNLYGYIWSDTLPIAQSAAAIGPYGLTFLTLLWAAIPLSLILGIRQYKKEFIIALLTLTASLFYGCIQLSQPVTYHDNFQVQIVQPNINQADKWDHTLFSQNFEQHIRLSERQEGAADKPTAIIWPETALSPALMNASAVRQRLNNLLKTHPDHSLLLTGALSVGLNDLGITEYYNNVTMIEKARAPSPLYTKSHLVPFGEYIPFQHYIPLETVSRFSGFVKGTGPNTLSIGQIPAFSPMICYEVIFPHKVVPKDNRPQWLLNVTNDAWYGMSAGPYQHFAQSRFRAIEQGLPLVRSANTGISGMIDPYGRVIASRSLMEQGLIISSLPQSRAATPYARYGDWLLVLLLMAAAPLLYRKQK